MFKCLNQSLHSNYQVTGHDRSVTDGHNKSPSEIIYTLNVTDGHNKPPSEIIYTLNPRSDTANYRLGWNVNSDYNKIEKGYTLYMLL